MKREMQLHLIFLYIDSYSNIACLDIANTRQGVFRATPLKNRKLLSPPPPKSVDRCTFLQL